MSPRILPTLFPTPRRMVIDGVNLLVCLPEPRPVQPEVPRARPMDQPMLPIEPPDADYQARLERAQTWVEALAETVSQVLWRRRPIAQLAELIDAESCQHLDALIRLDRVKPQAATTPWVQASTPHRIEACFSYRLDHGHVAAAVTLEQQAARWLCSNFRILLPGAPPHAGPARFLLTS